MFGRPFSFMYLCHYTHCCSWQCRVQRRSNHEISFYCVRGWILDRVVSKCYYPDRWYTKTFHRKKVTCGKCVFTVLFSFTLKSRLCSNCSAFIFVFYFSLSLSLSVSLQCHIAYYWFRHTSTEKWWLTRWLYCTLWSTGHPTTMASQ